MTMIPRVADFIHIKGEKKDVYHRVVNVNIENNIVEYIENNDDALSICHPIVTFDKIDEIK